VLWAYIQAFALIQQLHRLHHVLQKQHAGGTLPKPGRKELCRCQLSWWSVTLQSHHVPQAALPCWPLTTLRAGLPYRISAYSIDRS
jgi:hypothetical protein